jgi:hypothetical protein
MVPTWNLLAFLTGMAFSIGSSVGLWFGYRWGEEFGVFRGQIDGRMDRLEELVKKRKNQNEADQVS